MAAAEARAAWQRTANRCFVQEDAKRAPKLACCQSTSSSSKQVDSGPTSPSDEPDHPASGFMSRDKNSSFSALPPDMRWWVQMQPNYGYRNGLSHEQVKALEIEIETSESVSENPVSKSSNDSIYTNDHTESDSSLNVCLKKAEKEEVKENYEFIDMDAFDCKSVSKHSDEFDVDFDSPWIKIEKSLPWWRTTDIDEIADLVSRNKYECIQNCDLPQSKKLCMRKYPTSKFDFISKTDSISDAVCLDSIGTQRKEEICSEKLFSCSGTRQFPEGDTSKAELMEALRHSQTRAREAEKAAKEAYAEKEHVIQLFFKQASQLFAYRQWLQLLQFNQTFDAQIDVNSEPFSSVFPSTLQWMSYKGRTRPRGKNLQRQSRRRGAKRDQPGHDLGRYAIVFALGLSLVGAGLLLGWTIGWMLPPF